MAGHGGGWLLIAAALPPASPNLDWLNNYFQPLSGTWFESEALLGITWLQLLAAGASLSLAFLLSRLLQLYVRSRIKQQIARDIGGTAEQAIPPSWHGMILEAAAPPFSLLVWIWGISSTLWLILPAGDLPGVVFVGGALKWFLRAGSIGVLFWLLFRMVSVVELQLKRWAKRDSRRWDDVLVILVIRALRLVTPLAAAIFVIPTLDLPPSFHNVFDHAASLLLTASVGFIFYQLVVAGEDAVLLQYRIDDADNLATRKVQTQVRVLKRIAVVMIAIFTGASMLMVFDSVRHFGTSILASAGVAGIVAGFAAQRSLSTLLAGIQMAFTQPIRWDDVVVVEGEWGRIEEIALTYVVVRLWDLRRLIVPVSYFIEKPFQNWTRVTADILGTVMIYADYSAPLAAIRDELDHILAESKLWDGKVKALQVTDAKERSIELRILVSAPDAGTAWNLRCEVREKMVSFLQREYPQCLPRTRLETGAPSGECSPWNGRGAGSALGYSFEKPVP